VSILPPSSPIVTPSAAGRFGILLALGVLALCAGYVALVLGTSSWTDARRLDGLYPFDNWHIRPFGPAEWRWAQQGLIALAAGLGLGWLRLGPGSAAGRREMAATWAELRGGARRARAQWRGLPRRQRWLWWGHLVGLTAARLYLSLTTPWNDDAASLAFFVRHGLLAVSAYYPIPNNHVLANSLAWFFFQIHPSFWWAMRLPVLLTSTLATVVLFSGLLRRLGYWPALLAAGAMSWVQLGLYQAASGRGYWLVVLLTAVLFLALVALLADEQPLPAASRVAWLGLVVASILGSYTVPTFAYGLGSAFSWLGGQALLRGRWRLLGQAAGAGLLVGVGAALLYVPILLVSGPRALLANAYVQPLSGGEFWPALPTYVWLTECYLMGQIRVGAGVVLLGLLLFGQLLRQWAAGRLVSTLARQVTQVGLPALWFVLLPYLVLLGQRVLPPERTLLYKAWFFYLLVALVLSSWRWQSLVRRWLAGLAAGVFVLYEFTAQVRDNRLAELRLVPDHAVADWLARHPQARPVFVADDILWNGQQLEANVRQPNQPWSVDRVARPGVRYRYLITYRKDPVPAGAGALLFTQGRLQIFRGPTPAFLDSVGRRTSAMK
jgi:hypothetical protein